MVYTEAFPGVNMLLAVDDNPKKYYCSIRCVISENGEIYFCRYVSLFVHLSPLNMHMHATIRSPMKRLTRFSREKKVYIFYSPIK